MPLIAAIPAIIGAAGTISGSLINRSGRNSSTSSSSSSSLLPPGLDTTALTGLIGQQKDLANTLTTTGADTLGQGQDILGMPLSYFQDILGGDRTAINERMAPEIAAINAQFRQPLQETKIAGRDSGLFQDQEAARQAGISSVIFGARPAAADKLTSIAQALMNLGTTQTGMGGTILGQAAGEVLDYNALIRGLQQRQAESQAQSNSALFGTLGTTLGPILQTILSGGNSGGTNPTEPPIAFPTPGPVEEPPIPTPTVPNFASMFTSASGPPQINAQWLTDMMGGKSPQRR